MAMNLTGEKINRQLLKLADRPRPDWSRESLLLLNGEWEYREDGLGVGRLDRWSDARAFDKTIEVPFCVESEASGAAVKNPSRVVWMKKRFRVDSAFRRGRSLILNFGAADYEARVWLNGKYLGSHKGGYSPFSFDITETASAGENALAVRISDSRDPRIPRGKQTFLHKPFSIFYSTVTGLWQPVWIEAAGLTRAAGARVDSDPDEGRVRLSVDLEGPEPPAALRVSSTLPSGKAFSRTFAGGELRMEGKKAQVEFIVPEVETWSPDRPRLNPMKIELMDARSRVVDAVDSYFAFRTVAISGGRILLNGKPLYQKLLLDQGFFPSGHYTPVDPAEFRRDVELAKAMGFNGVRKHQKIEDPRSLFWCDALGLLVWEEMPSAFLWSAKMRGALESQWREIVARDRNHPCIIAWVPLNESWGVNNLIFSSAARDFVARMYDITKEMDPTRLVVDNSGFEHVKTDIVDLHHYLGTAQKAREWHAKLRDPKNMEFDYANLLRRLNPAESAVCPLAPGVKYEGQPMLVSEYGGFGFYKAEDKSLIENFRDYTLAIAEEDIFQGYCYTQFYDTEQERNGLLNFDRTPKIPLEEIRAVNEEAGRIAAERDKERGRNRNG
ncbi:MAG TPA: glycoside hydrolase family 2 TIM barrel-domain containing protein [bacterium]|nr:glycoside hydrolase family 2 TIM barrel-domain containing protein [bacterium]